MISKFQIVLYTILFLLVSCSKNETVAGGFGSETSTGIVMTFASANDNAQIEYSVFQDTATRVSEDVLVPLLTDTVVSNSVDTIELANGSYTVVSHELNSDNYGISQSITIDDAKQLPVVVTDLKKYGTLALRFSKELRTSDCDIFIVGTPFQKDLLTVDSVSYASSNDVVTYLTLPESMYDHVSLLDLRNDSTVVISTPFSILSDDTTEVFAIDSNWFEDSVAIKMNGVLALRFSRDLRNRDLELTISGTSYGVDLINLDTAAYYSTNEVVAYLSLPDGSYDNVSLLDLRDSSIIPISNSFTIVSEDTTAVLALESSWPEADKSDGQVTVNWNYTNAIESAMVGLDDTVVTTLTPLWYNSVDSRETVEVRKNVGIGGAVTFTGISYGLYNLSGYGTESGQHLSVLVLVSNNQPVIVSDTLRDPVSIELTVAPELLGDNPFYYIQGTGRQVILTGASTIIDSVPVGLRCKIVLTDQSSPKVKLGESEFFTVSDSPQSAVVVR